MISRAHAADGETVVIGSGTAAGVYFPAAGAICQRVNGARGDGDPTCVVVPGEGSKARLEALRAGNLDFAIVQSDWQFWAHPQYAPQWLIDIYNNYAGNLKW